MSVQAVYSRPVAAQPEAGALRIGEFARRVGVSAELLRAWERRYGLLQPIRSAGGFRLYTDADAERVARMRRGLDGGLSAAEAARSAVAVDRPSVNLLAGAADRLYDAIERYDETAVHTVLDESLAAFGLEPLIGELILPVLQRVGRAWEQGALEIGHEHFASNLIRGRLLSLARLWGRGAGPLALLACVPGEEHDISLLAFGLVLRSHGWRILFLGANTPLPTIVQTIEATGPEIVVLTTFRPHHVEAVADDLRALAGTVPLAISGPGASAELCAALGIGRLGNDLVQAAGAVASGAFAR